MTNPKFLQATIDKHQNKLTNIANQINNAFFIPSLKKIVVETINLNDCSIQTALNDYIQITNNIKQTLWSHCDYHSQFKYDWSYDYIMNQLNNELKELQKDLNESQNILSKTKKTPFNLKP